MKPLIQPRRDWKLSGAFDFPRPGIVEAPPDACPTCGGLGTVYELSADSLKAKLGVYELSPCPDCRRAACPCCGDTGMVRYNVGRDHPDFGKLFPCPANCEAVQAARARHTDAVRNLSQLPPEYQTLTLASFEHLSDEEKEGKMGGYYAAWLFVRGMAAGNCAVDRRDIAYNLGKDAPSETRNWLVFYGEHGRGKTGMAAAIVNAAMEIGKQAVYIRLQDFIDAVQRRYTREKAELERIQRDEFGEMTSSEVVEFVKTAPLLLIDEADVPDIKPDKEALFERVIRYRHSHHLPTVLTTNLDADGFGRRWDKKIADIVRRCAWWMPMRGESLRGDVGAYEWE